MPQHATHQLLIIAADTQIWGYNVHTLPNQVLIGPTQATVVFPNTADEVNQIHMTEMGHIYVVDDAACIYLFQWTSRGLETLRTIRRAHENVLDML
jgi:hypothetical protein